MTDNDLIDLIEVWDDLTWLQRKRIMWIVVYRPQLRELWPRICLWFFDL